FLDRLNALDFDMFVSGFSFGLDPDNYGLWHSSRVPDPATGKKGFNRAAFSTPELDELFEKARTLPGCDPNERKKLYARTQEILAENQPWNFLFQERSLLAVNKRVGGVDPSSFRGVNWNANKWFIK